MAVAPTSLTTQLTDAILNWSTSQRSVVELAVQFADSSEWAVPGTPSAAHWIAWQADIEVCTAREWIRVGRRLHGLPEITAAFERGDVSYSKVRVLSRLATPSNEAELLAIAVDVPAGGDHLIAEQLPDLRDRVGARTDQTCDQFVGADGADPKTPVRLVGDHALGAQARQRFADGPQADFQPASSEAAAPEPARSDTAASDVGCSDADPAASDMSNADPAGVAGSGAAS